jgi:hypothetical protein
MPSVRSLGAFPWCPFKDKDDVITNLFSPDPSLFDDYSGILEGLSVPLRQAMAMFWRVKTWRIQGAISASDGGDPSLFPFDVTVGPQVDSERELVCRNSDGSTWQAIPWNEGGFTISGGNLGGSYDIIVKLRFFDSPFILPESLKYGFSHFVSWPPSSFDSDVYVWTDLSILTEDGGVAIGEIYNQSSDIHTNESSCSISFLDEVYEMPIFSSGFGAFSASIEANEYWPYDPEDGGGPIYDTLTGEQLRDFPD